jgi:uncharacterized protein
MEVRRLYENTLLSNLKPNKVLVLMGARRVGKTSLLKKVLAQTNESYLLLNGDDIETHNLLEKQSVANYTNLLGASKLLVIDEAQEIPGIGKKLKLMVDSIEGLKILITGSSAFEISNQIGEPLVGRMRALHLFPLAQIEFAQHENSIQTQSNLEERLVFGAYPELTALQSRKEKASYLKEIVGNHLLRDIMAFEGIRKREKIISLLQKVAYRTGTEISMEAMGKELQVSKNTIEKYLDLFTKVFILYSMSGFSRNRDNEISKMKKWYFMDNGIRNAIISDFSSLNMRTDIGQLWENYLNAERIKVLHYKEIDVDQFFWRTHSRQEIDRIEEMEQQLTAYEFKWGKKKPNIPTAFAQSYPNATFNTINQENYLRFVLGEI